MTQGALVKPGDRGFLAAALGPGMRAVTVPVSAQSAVAGFVFPGDRVDLMLTQSVVGGGDGPPLKASETILRNLRVLATDQKTDKTTDDKGNTVVTTYSNVTVEATPKIAEKIAVAQTVGSSRCRCARSPTIRANSRSDRQRRHQRARRRRSEEGKGNDGAQAAARPQEGAPTFATGADVSRFQRSTVPAKPERARGSACCRLQAIIRARTVAKGPVVTIVRGNSVPRPQFLGGKN
jgi:pilus assembly protein CpaB